MLLVSVLKLACPRSRFNLNATFDLCATPQHAPVPLHCAVSSLLLTMSECIKCVSCRGAGVLYFVFRDFLFRHISFNGLGMSCRRWQWCGSAGCRSALYYPTVRTEVKIRIGLHISTTYHMSYDVGSNSEQKES